MRMGEKKNQPEGMIRLEKAYSEKLDSGNCMNVTITAEIVGTNQEDPVHASSAFANLARRFYFDLAWEVQRPTGGVRG